MPKLKIHYADEFTKNYRLCSLAKNIKSKEELLKRSNINIVTCIRCLKSYPKFIKIAKLLGKCTDRFLAKISGFDKNTILRFRKTLKISCKSFYTGKPGEIWKPVQRNSLCKIEVSQFGNFRRVNDKRLYDLRYDRGRLWLNVKSKNGNYIEYSAVRIVYETFHNKTISHGTKILFKDNDFTNLHIENLVLYKHIRNTTYHDDIQYWSTLIQPGDTRKIFFNKAHLSVRRGDDRILFMKRKLGLATKNTIILYDLINKYLEHVFQEAVAT